MYHVFTLKSSSSICLDANIKCLWPSTHTSSCRKLSEKVFFHQVEFQILGMLGPVLLTSSVHSPDKALMFPQCCSNYAWIQFIQQDFINNGGGRGENIGRRLILDSSIHFGNNKLSSSLADSGPTLHLLVSHCAYFMLHQHCSSSSLCKSTPGCPQA